MEARPSGKRTCLYNATQLDAVLDNMALQLAGLLGGERRIMVVGILRRGAPLAAMLQQRLANHLKVANIPLMHLQIKRYADDLTLLHPETKLTENHEHEGMDLSGVTVVVVDDVMYRGHSMLRAVEYLTAKHADEIRTVVLVDRGVTKLPVRSDIVGVKLNVAPTDIVECNIPPSEAEFKIELLQPS
ncbi:MAG: phosphoribosyltransferase family protein [Candidatus Nitrotoga sp.]